MHSPKILLAAALVALAADLAHAQTVLENDNIRLALDARGRVASVFDKLNQRELRGEPTPAFGARVGQQLHACSSVTQQGDTLVVAMADIEVTATIRTTVTPHYIALQLHTLEGPAVDSFVLLTLSLTPQPSLDRWLGISYDDQYAVVVCAGDYFTRHLAKAGKADVTISLACEREVRQQDNRAVLMGCPTKEVLDYVDVLERDLGMPRGGRNRQHRLQGCSYFWCSPTPANIDQYIGWAKKGGFRQILFSYTAFTTSCGHFQFKPTYPNGLADLKRVVGKIRAAGLSAGLHIHFNKAHKHDPYVTPVPDKRFHKTETLVLPRRSTRGLRAS